MLRRWVVLALIAFASLPGCEKDKGMERQPEPGPLEPQERRLPVPEAAIAEARELVELRVAEGFETREEIIEGTVDLLSMDYDEQLLSRVVPQLTAAALDAHRAREASWTAPTDCDRLDAAFAALDRAGILARQNFSDCGTCGAGEMHELMEQERAAGRHFRGYTFYHQQDTESALDGTLYLAYGSVQASDEAAVAIGHEVEASLRRHGLETSWSGDLSRRIAIVDLTWQRRRFTRSPPPGAGRHDR